MRLVNLETSLGKLKKAEKITDTDAGIIGAFTEAWDKFTEFLYNKSKKK